MTVIGLPFASFAPVRALAVTVAPVLKAAMVGTNVMEACPVESVGTTTTFALEPKGDASPPIPDVRVKVTKAFVTGFPLVSVASTVNGETLPKS